MNSLLSVSEPMNYLSRLSSEKSEQLVALFIACAIELNDPKVSVENDEPSSVAKEKITSYAADMVNSHLFELTHHRPISLCPELPRHQAGWYFTVCLESKSSVSAAEVAEVLVDAYGRIARYKPETIAKALMHFRLQLQ